LKGERRVGVSMIISRTPVRVSFCGGGTDLPAYYEGSENGGLVTSMGLARHIHVTVNARFDDSVRVGYSRTEIVDDFEELEHELVREAMRLTGVTAGIEITTIADIPSRGTGLGSSSTLTVGLLNALHNFAGRTPDAAQLAEEACRIEIDILGQPIGRQDQYAAAFGGANQIAFMPDDSVIITPLDFDAAALEAHYFLVYTGMTRKATDILGRQSASSEKKRSDLDALRQQAIEVRAALDRMTTPRSAPCSTPLGRSSAIWSTASQWASWTTSTPASSTSAPAVESCSAPAVAASSSSKGMPRSAPRSRKTTRCCR